MVYGDVFVSNPLKNSLHTQFVFLVFSSFFCVSFPFTGFHLLLSFLCSLFLKSNFLFLVKSFYFFSSLTFFYLYSCFQYFLSQIHRCHFIMFFFLICFPDLICRFVTFFVTFQCCSYFHCFSLFSAVILVLFVAGFVFFLCFVLFSFSC